jgi:hypothetical protein
MAEGDDEPLNSRFAAWLDGKAVSLLPHIKDLTEQRKTRNKSSRPLHPDHPIAAKITDNEIVGELTLLEKDVAGRPTSFVFPHNGAFLGFEKEGMQEVRRLIEKICSRPEINAALTTEVIQRLVLDWVRRSARGETVDTLSSQIASLLEEVVSEVAVWVPLESTHTEVDVPFADGLITTLTKSEIDAAVDRTPSQRSEADLAAAKLRWHERYAGRACWKFVFKARPEKAAELGLEKAADYTTLLQFLCAPAFVFSLTSHIAPNGARPYRSRDYVLICDTNLSTSRGIAETPWELNLTAEVLKGWSKMGFVEIERLAREQTCEYEEALFACLLVYGRACYQTDPMDKLLQIFTAIEMLCLRGESEPISHAVADRIAFGISRVPGKRRDVVQNFRAAYALRSQRAHHGKSMSDVATIETFLANAWNILLIALKGVGHFKKRAEFLNYLDALKYGG